MGRRNPWRAYTKENERITDLKLELCKKIYWEMIYQKKTTGHYCAQLGTSAATLSRIRQLRTEQLSLDQLFFFLSRLKPAFRFLIAADG